MLTDAVLQASGQLGPLHYQPGEIRPIDHALDGPQLHKLNQRDIEQFKRGMRGRVNQLLKQLHRQIADPVADLIVDALIDRVTKPEPDEELGVGAGG